MTKTFEQFQLNKRMEQSRDDRIRSYYTDHQYIKCQDDLEKLNKYIEYKKCQRQMSQESVVSVGSPTKTTESIVKPKVSNITIIKNCIKNFLTCTKEGTQASP